MPPVPLDFSDSPNFWNPRGLVLKQAGARRQVLKPRDTRPNFVVYDDNEFKQTTTERAKRSMDSIELTPSPKRKCQFFTSTPIPREESASEPTELTVSSIIEAVEKLSTEPRLVADGSRANILPTIHGKHSDMCAISPETLIDVLDGAYDNKMEKVTIIDCRYPYEYNGGHIKGAVNLYTKEAIQNFLQESVTSSTPNHVLIFHCEFSSERGPKMYRFLRSLDREMNKDCYPRLHFPEIYLLEGGYKSFFFSCKEKCTPQKYKPMLHKEHKEDLRHFRVKSKSWSTGDKPHKASIKGTGLRLRF